MAAVTICSDFGAPKNKVWRCFLTHVDLRGGSLAPPGECCPWRPPDRHATYLCVHPSGFWSFFPANLLYFSSWNMSLHFSDPETLVSLYKLSASLVLWHPRFLALILCSQPFLVIFSRVPASASTCCCPSCYLPFPLLLIGAVFLSNFLHSSGGNSHS